MKKGFQTSFGTTIPLIPGYKEAHPKIRISDIITPYAEMVPDKQMGIDGFIKDVYEYAMMMDFLENLGIKTRWDKGLDLGGAEGTMSRLLRGEGKLKTAVTVDISDVSHNLSTQAFLKHYVRFRAACIASRFSPTLKSFLLGDGLWHGRHLTPLFNHWGYWPPASSKFWNLTLKKAPKIDRYITGDVYDLQEKFDLITAFFCLDYFNIDKIFATISRLLTEGGTFFMAVNYWWYSVSAAGIVGDFPYCCQRLTREDFIRYFQEFHPEEADDALQRYNYYHQSAIHPTLNDYAEIADRYDMTTLGSTRLTPPRDVHHRSAVTPTQLNQFEDSRLQDVLADVRRFRPDVGLLDLQTAHVMLVFQKRTKQPRSLETYLQSQEFKEKQRGLDQ